MPVEGPRVMDSCTPPDQAMDYRRSDAWDQLANALTDQFEARPADDGGIVDCPPGWRWSPRLTDFDLWFASKGRGTFRVGAHEFPIAAGTLFLLRPGDAGFASQDPHNRLSVIYLHFSFVAPASGSPVDIAAGLLPSRHVPFADPARIEPLLMRIQRLLDSRLPLARAEAGLTLRQALIQIYRQDAANQAIALPRLDPRVERVIAHVRRAPHQRTSLGQAASIACLAPEYFSRIFTREMGISFREFVVTVRLERASYFLRETDMSIGEIAESLGYDSVFLFSRQFKLRYAVPPSRLRKSARGFDV